MANKKLGKVNAKEGGRWSLRWQSAPCLLLDCSVVVVRNSFLPSRLWQEKEEEEEEPGQD